MGGIMQSYSQIFEEQEKQTLRFPGIFAANDSAKSPIV